MTAPHVLEAWAIHDRINRYLLAAVPDAALSAVSASKGRAVAEQFAHIHNVRLMWLKAAQPAALAGLTKLEKGALTKKVLHVELEKSGAAMGGSARTGLRRWRPRERLQAAWHGILRVFGLP